MPARGELALGVSGLAAKLGSSAPEMRTTVRPAFGDGARCPPPAPPGAMGAQAAMRRMPRVRAAKIAVCLLILRPSSWIARHTSMSFRTCEARRNPCPDYGFLVLRDSE